MRAGDLCGGNVNTEKLEKKVMTELDYLKEIVDELKGINKELREVKVRLDKALQNMGN